MVFFKHGTGLFLTRAQRIFRVSASGNIPANAQYAHEPSVTFINRGFDGFQNFFVSVMETDLFLIYGGFPRDHCLSVMLAEKIRAFSVHEVEICFSDNFFFLCTEKFLKSGIAQQINAFRVFEPDQIRNCANQCPQTRFTSFQILFCAPAAADVTGYAHITDFVSLIIKQGLGDNFHPYQRAVFVILLNLKMVDRIKNSLCFSFLSLFMRLCQNRMKFRGHGVRNAFLHCLFGCESPKIQNRRTDIRESEIIVCCPKHIPDIFCKKTVFCLTLSQSLFRVFAVCDVIIGNCHTISG